MASRPGVRDKSQEVNTCEMSRYPLKLGAQRSTLCGAYRWLWVRCVQSSRAADSGHHAVSVTRIGLMPLPTAEKRRGRRSAPAIGDSRAPNCLALLGQPCEEAVGPLPTKPRQTFWLLVTRQRKVSDRFILLKGPGATPTADSRDAQPLPLAGRRRRGDTPLLVRLVYRYSN